MIAPSPKAFHISSPKDDLSSHAHRQLIGYLGLSLPFLLWFISACRPTDGLPQWSALCSISAYYYTGAVSVLVGILVALALFLFSYRGYGNPYQLYDRAAAAFAAVSALAVAGFPVDPPGGLPAPSWWTPATGTIHNWGALALFAAFIFLALVQFPRSRTHKWSLCRPSGNWVYLVCGLGMVVCIAWIVVATLREKPIFWPESGALFFFALSWLKKGRALATITYYSRNPGVLVHDAWGKMLGR